MEFEIVNGFRISCFIQKDCVLFLFCLPDVIMDPMERSANDLWF